MAYGNKQRAWTYEEYVQKYEQLQAKNKLIKGLIKMALNELGVPNKDYPAPITNAVDFLREALKDGE